MAFAHCVTWLLRHIDMTYITQEKERLYTHMPILTHAHTHMTRCWCSTTHVQPIPLGVTFSNAVSKLKAQSSNVSFHWNVAQEALELSKMSPKWDWRYIVVHDSWLACIVTHGSCALNSSYGTHQSKWLILRVHSTHPTTLIHQNDPYFVCTPLMNHGLCACGTRCRISSLL